ncbi:MAG: transposase, partial [Nocardioidaceae bacterium]
MVAGMPYPNDLSDGQWALVERLLADPSKRGPKHGPDLRRVLNGMLYVAHTGCQGATCPRSSVPGLGSGRSSGAGHATAPGRGCWQHCTRSRGVGR